MQHKSIHTVIVKLCNKLFAYTRYAYAVYSSYEELLIFRSEQNKPQRGSSLSKD